MHPTDMRRKITCQPRSQCLSGNEVGHMFHSRKGLNRVLYSLTQLETDQKTFGLPQSPELKVLFSHLLQNYKYMNKSSCCFRCRDLFLVPWMRQTENSCSYLSLLFRKSSDPFETGRTSFQESSLVLG